MFHGGPPARRQSPCLLYIPFRSAPTRSSAADQHRIAQNDSSVILFAACPSASNPANRFISASWCLKLLQIRAEKHVEPRLVRGSGVCAATGLWPVHRLLRAKTEHRIFRCARASSRSRSAMRARRRIEAGLIRTKGCLVPRADAVAGSCAAVVGRRPTP